jgi:hypothetical protein
LRQDLETLRELKPRPRSRCGALSADELEKLFWRLVAYVACAITDREIETAALAIELWRAAALIQAGPEGHGPRLMWREVLH